MSPLSRLGALVATSALTLGGLAVAAVPASAVQDADPRPLALGADWLAGALEAGLLQGDFGPLYGPSIDAALSLKAAGGHADAVQDVADAIADNLTSYIEYSYPFDSDEDGVDELYEGEAAGSTAKALVLAQSLDTPSNSLAGVDLAQRVDGYVADAGPIEGRLVGVATKDGADDPDGEFTNVIGQAFGVAGLRRAGSPEAASALDYLLKQQCTAGYFRESLTFDKTAVDQTCNGASSAPSLDTTATVVRLLQPQAGVNQSVAAALVAATDWLAAQQAADGSFGSNANTTGSVGYALGLRGKVAAASRAAAWVRAHQSDEFAGCLSALSNEPGAIAYNDAALTLGRANGITPATSQQWRFAAAQALPVLRWAPSAVGTPSVAAPSGFVKAGSTQTYRLSGIAPGETVCVTTPAGSSRVSTLGGVAQSAVPMGSATGTATVTFRTRTATLTRTTKVLGAKKLTVKKSKATVKKNKTFKVTVTGLAPGEKVLVKVRSSRKTGTANAKGTFVATLKPGSKLGKFTITAVGQFSDIRRGTSTVKVVK